MHLNEWFNKGINPEQYIESLDQHRDSFLHIYNNFQVPTDDYATLENKENIRTIVLAEPWCGHCMLDIPILLRMTERANIPVRFLPRDDHLELMDQYLTNDKRYLPIFIFIDEAGNELSKWGPMAPEIFDYAERLKADIPPKDDPAYKEAFRTYAEEVGKTFRTNQTFWNYVYEDVKKSLP